MGAPHEGSAAYWRAMYEDQLRRKRLLHERFDRLHRVARKALDVLGAMHVAEEGPEAGWHENGGELWYDEDLRCRADCPVCAAETPLREALA